MISYQIAIPSYQRTDTLKQKTLSLLSKYEIDPAIVTIFVANEEQHRQYEAALADTPYRNLVVGELGMGAIRRFIHKHYDEGIRPVSLDDDLEQILRKVDAQRICEVVSLEDEVIRPGFKACEKHGARLWGIYAAENPYYMKHRVAVGLRFIVGSLWGCINRRQPEFQVTVDEKEDYERSFQYFRADGNVCRLDNITVKTRYYREKGGMQVTRTKERVLRTTEYLADKYSDLCTMYIRDSTGYAELKLKSRRGQSQRASDPLAQYDWRQLLRP